MAIETVDSGPFSMAGAGPYGGPANQPWTRVVWPEPALWADADALGLPAVGRAVALIAGQVRQMPMDAYRGVEPLPRPRLLDAPDPENARSWYVGQQISDYLLHGNAISYATAYNAEGFPAATVWLPASRCNITWNPDATDPLDAEPRYWFGGYELDAGRLTHVKRGADDFCPVRGVGVVEQYVAALARITNIERYESSALSGSGVPSVAVITPNPRLGADEARLAKEAWAVTFGGPVRETAILPAGTQVIPLAWSPTDTQLQQARKMSLQDVANMFNLDGYYLGAEASSLTYRSPGPLFLQLLRITLEPIIADFEGMWSLDWLPRGQRVRFDRNVLLRDDLATTVVTLTTAVTAGLFSLEEARLYLGLPATIAGATVGPTGTSPIDTQEGTEQ